MIPHKITDDLTNLELFLKYLLLQESNSMRMLTLFVSDYNTLEDSLKTYE